MKKRGADHQEIIVKRRAKKGHDDDHGGAWKVAFADFTMAMMALFMVLWIVQPQSKNEAPVISEEFANPVLEGGAGVFDGSSTTPLDLDGVPVQVIRRDDDPYNDALTPDALREGAPRSFESRAELKELAELLQKVAEQADALANVQVEVVPQGLRLLLKDDAERFMFKRGGTLLDAHFEKLLKQLAGVLAKVENKLIISGHTDAAPYRTRTGYNNWNLSGDRAQRARQVLVESGMPVEQVLQVTAQADTTPLDAQDPESGVNRRIELLLLTSDAETLYRELFGKANPQVQFSSGG